jgi:hypothetical protein
VSDGEWRVVASFGDRISAQALQGLLESEGLPCQLISNGAIPGLGTEFAVLVPTPLLARAHTLREQAQVPLEELTYLATGERAGPDTG